MAIWAGLLADRPRDESAKPDGAIRVVLWMAILVFVSPYLFNFVWESFHSVYLYMDAAFGKATTSAMIRWNMAAVDFVDLLGDPKTLNYRGV